MFNSLLGAPAKRLPNATSGLKKLADDFNGYFIGKVEAICAGMTHAGMTFEVPPPSILERFDPVTHDEVYQVVKSTSNSSSPADVMPTKIFKSFLPNFIVIFTMLLNLSLFSGVFPDSWKTGVICPIIKKPNLDVNNMSFYRPILNLLFPSKVLEKLVLEKLPTTQLLSISQ